MHGSSRILEFAGDMNVLDLVGMQREGGKANRLLRNPQPVSEH